MNASLPTIYATSHVIAIKKAIAQADDGDGLTLFEISKEAGMRVADVASILEKSPDDFHSERNEDNVILWTLNKR